MNDSRRHRQGMTVRRAVLGDAHVDRAIAATTDFNQDFQDYITRNAWGEVWTRPGLPRATRSLLTLVMLVALNRGDEFRLHVRGALRNGVTPAQIREALLQCAVYCGVPAANAAFQLAAEVLREAEVAAKPAAKKKSKSR